MPFDDRRILVSPTGASLNLYTRRPDGPARAVVQINHGLAEHAARYARFADFLAARGFHTYAHDHRGHGFTTAPDAPQGMFGKPDGGAKVIADVAAVHDLIAKEHPGLPVIVFGHSMGGLIALNFVLRHSAGIHAAAIWNANFSAGIAGRAAQAILAWEKFRLGSDVPSRLLPRLTFQAWGKQIPNHRTAFDWLSRDPAGGRQICRGPALRLGRLGLAVAGSVRLRLLWRRRPQLFRRPQGPRPSTSSAAKKTRRPTAARR